MESAPARVVFPRVGEVLAGFRLLAELGRGAAGRVFLAAQPSLGDRPVVLKVTPRGREEHLSLARLQHRTSCRSTPSRCSGTGTSGPVHALPRRGDDGPGPRDARGPALTERTGKQLVEALDRLQAGGRWPASGGPFRRFSRRALLRRGDLLDRRGARRRPAICPRTRPRAHGRQAVERAPGRRRPADAAGFPPGPQADRSRTAAPGLDGWDAGVHVARAVAGDGGRARGPADPRRGRRPGRHLLAGDAAVCRARRRLCRSRADTPPPPLHRRNPRVSVGLSDIIHKCLRRDPGDRYPDAAALATTCGGTWPTCRSGASPIGAGPSDGASGDDGTLRPCPAAGWSGWC